MSIEIQKNISLSKYTSFKIGGTAKYFCVVENGNEIKEALKFAEKNKLNVFILGGGSNLLISDQGFNGLVIKIHNSQFTIHNSNIICGSGLSLVKLISESIKNNLTGLEWAAGIPGTVGGAVANNAGANGMSMSDIVKEAEILEIGNWKLEIRKLRNKECGFSYRNSVFKKEKKYIILSVVLKLENGSREESKKIILKYLKSRSDKQPLEYPSAGSIFKNPAIDDDHLAKLIKKYPELKDISKNNTIPAGWLIGQIDELRNKKIGGTMISEKHCNFIVNFDNAKAEEMIILISLIKQKVRMYFGIQLKEEIEYVGF
ncbi:MAG: UDP-N-acetylmuramate dehydrogenase [Patescibacteria group bacterium]|nr:UDP-N-acetylmuramate dehydrogenase [Patescibacteria group bacterium]